MESIFREKFEKEEEKYYQLRASDVPNDNRLDRLKVDLQRDIDELKSQFESNVEDGPSVVSEEEEDLDKMFDHNHENSNRVKRHNSKKKSPPCHPNLCSFPFRTQYGGQNKDTKLNKNNPPTSCDDLGRMGHTMSALYPVKDDASSEKLSIVHCEFNSPKNGNTITSNIHKRNPFKIRL